jgi:hypothetical protein
MDWFMATSMVLMVLPYATYTWAFKYPRSISRFVTQPQLVELAQYAKLICIACAAPTVYRAGVNAAGLCIGLPLAFIGQYLSELVYSILGDAGVYYGIELQTVKPRNINGFPFSISDPMYRGSILTLIGLLFCLNTTRDVVILAFPWVLSYFCQICIENTQGAIDRA